MKEIIPQYTKLTNQQKNTPSGRMYTGDAEALVENRIRGHPFQKGPICHA